jgi:hypothetical protein
VRRILSVFSGYSYHAHMAEVWPPAQFKELAGRYLTSTSQEPGTFQERLNRLFLEAFEHYDDASPEGKAYLNRVLVGFAGMFEASLEKLPDTPDRRKMKRLLSSVKGTHFQAESLFESFPIVSDPESDRMKKALALLTRAMQVLMDTLHDATRNSHQGPGKFAIIGLYFWLLDEITVAQYLARRSYSTLAYTHLRSVMEIIDKVELFTKKPAEADIWVSGDEREIWRKLAPARVREKLGRSSSDPLYHYFSAQGSHPTFTAMQSRVRRTNKSEGEGLTVSVLIGGIKDEPRQLSILLYAVVLVNIGTMRAIAAFEDRLHPGDIASLVVPITDETFAVFEGFLAEGGVDVGEAPLGAIRGVWEKLKISGSTKPTEASAREESLPQS